MEVIADLGGQGKLGAEDFKGWRAEGEVRLGEKGLGLREKGGVDPGIVVVDASRLEEVIAVLVNDGAKLLPAGGWGP